MFYPQLADHFNRPLQLKKYLYGADFGGKSQYDTLDNFLQESIGYQWCRNEGCLYVYRKGNIWKNMIKYIDDALYFASENELCTPRYILKWVQL